MNAPHFLNTLDLLPFFCVSEDPLPMHPGKFSNIALTDIRLGIEDGFHFSFCLIAQMEFKSLRIAGPS